MDKSEKFLCLNIYVLYVLLWTKYWLMWFESLLVFMLLKFKKNIPTFPEFRLYLNVKLPKYAIAFCTCICKNITLKHNHTSQKHLNSSMNTMYILHLQYYTLCILFYFILTQVHSIVKYTNIKWDQFCRLSVVLLIRSACPLGKMFTPTRIKSSQHPEPRCHDWSWWRYSLKAEWQMTKWLSWLCLRYGWQRQLFYKS